MHVHVFISTYTCFKILCLGYRWATSHHKPFFEIFPPKKFKLPVKKEEIKVLLKRYEPYLDMGSCLYIGMSDLFCPA